MDGQETINSFLEPLRTFPARGDYRSQLAEISWQCLDPSMKHAIT
jgi:hypothetical protein